VEDKARRPDGAASLRSACAHGNLAAEWMANFVYERIHRHKPLHNQVSRQGSGRGDHQSLLFSGTLVALALFQDWSPATSLLYRIITDLIAVLPFASKGIELIV